MKATDVCSGKHYALRMPVLFFIGLMMLSTVAYGQGTANIVGTVTDPTGAVVPNAKVTVTNTDNGFTRNTSSNGTGSYSARELPIGHYQVHVEAQGFKSFAQTSLQLNVGDTVRVDASLQVGSVGQGVTVEADAIQVQSETNEISQTVTASQIANLATNGRNVLQLTTLVPGAASNMPDFDPVVGAQFQNRSIQFNGMRSDANNWLIAERPRRESMKRLPKGCGYQGFEFGARSYPDSLCCGGRLYDTDDFEEPAEDIPCPNCREKDAIEYWFDRFTLGGEESGSARNTAKNLVAHIRQNCISRAEKYKTGEPELSM